MNQYECKKVENCFSGAHVYEYRLPVKLAEGVIEQLGIAGSIKYYKNFPRPCFQIILTEGTTIKGIINDIVIKVSFPADNPQRSKETFELFLAELLAKQTGGGEDGL